MAASEGAILLTGGSGVAGQALLEQLPAERVICLVHRHPVRSAQVECVTGDVTAARFGLGENQFADLAARVECIIHSAAVTNFFTVDREVVERANLQGTERALEFASLAGAPLHFVSTAFVGGSADSRPGDGDPRRELPGIAATAEGYRFSKLESERLVRDSGLRCAVHRPSIMFGDSRTGAMSRFQGIHATFHTMARGEVPALPVSPNGRMDLIPQDIVAGAIAGLVERERHEGLYWLTLGERALSVERVIALSVKAMAEHGFDFQAPTIVDPSMIEQLMEPAVMAQLSPQAREGFERHLGGLIVGGPRDPMPSSLPELEDEGIVSLPDPAAAFLNGILYWARAVGLIEGPSAVHPGGGK
jgi:nucleoside-diphosphate-sugar epimerase